MSSSVQVHQLGSPAIVHEERQSLSTVEIIGQTQAEFRRADRRNRASSSLRKRIGILGVPINNLTLDEAVEILDLYIQEGSFRQIATANVDFLIKARQDNELMEILHQCSIVLADGMPLVWASRLLGTPLRERATGADLVPRLIELAANRAYSIYLLGAEENHSLAAAEWIRRRHPEARLVGRYSPPLADLEKMDHEYILRSIEQARPDILLVAFGNPKQEKWLAMHRHRLKVPVCVGVGASLSFLSGAHQRAPHWMQQCGLEWLHRLCREPIRLAPRYFSNAAGLLRYFSRQLLLASTQRGAGSNARLVQRWENGISVVTIPGDFSGTVVTEFESLLYRTGTSDCSIILDLSRTHKVGADAIGALIHLGTRMQSENRKLWLVGVRPSLRRVLRGSFLGGQFQFSTNALFATRRIGKSTGICA
jgi:N-acetylglucosaminyldiphosphoundecaprenol N-acetyl-beta-D-mannosaminyltransferase